MLSEAERIAEAKPSGWNVVRDTGRVGSRGSWQFFEVPERILYLMCDRRPLKHFISFQLYFLKTNVHLFLNS